MIAVEIALKATNPNPVSQLRAEATAEQFRQQQHLLTERESGVNVRTVVAFNQVDHDQPQLVQRLGMGMGMGMGLAADAAALVGNSSAVNSFAGSATSSVAGSAEGIRVLTGGFAVRERQPLILSFCRQHRFVASACADCGC